MLIGIALLLLLVGVFAISVEGYKVGTAFMISSVLVVRFLV